MLGLFFSDTSIFQALEKRMGIKNPRLANDRFLPSCAIRLLSLQLDVHICNHYFYKV